MIWKRYDHGHIALEKLIKNGLDRDNKKCRFSVNFECANFHANLGYRKIRHNNLLQLMRRYFRNEFDFIQIVSMRSHQTWSVLCISYVIN